MAALDRATFETSWADELGGFKDNVTRDISEGKLRQFAQDIVDTFAIGSTSNVLSTQTFNVGDMNMDSTSTKTVYCGPSSNVISCKFFGALVIADPDSGLPYAKYPLPYMIGGSAVCQTSSLFIFGASAAVNVSRVSGSFFDGTDFDSVNYNRGIISLFF